MAVRYPKGDLRRMLQVLGVLGEGSPVTVLQIAERTGLDRKTIATLLQQAWAQAEVKIEKEGSCYRLIEWGPVFRAEGARLALQGGLGQRGLTK